MESEYESFTFKGISSASMSVYLQTLFADGSKTPAMKYERVDIDGRDGGIYIPLGYDDIERDLNFVLLDRSKEGEVRAWLQGEGILQIASRQKTIRFLDSIVFQLMAGWRTEEFTTSVLMEPFWESADSWQAVASGGRVTNAGTVPSAPEIRITGNGEGAVNIGGQVIGLSFPATAGVVVIDCKAKEEDHPEWVKLGWEYPELVPGDNAVSYSGGVTKVEARRRSRWI